MDRGVEKCWICRFLNLPLESAGPEALRIVKPILSLVLQGGRKIPPPQASSPS